MIKIENTEVYGWEAALRGMRNPLNSWGKADSGMCYSYDLEDCEKELVECPRKYEEFDEDVFCIGKNDYDLAKRLVKAGPEHAKFLRMITVTCDITAPLYLWKEYDTYKVGTVASSCSTMHKIHAKEFTLDDFSCEHLTPEFLESLEKTITTLNEARDAYNWCNTESKKDWWWQMIQLLPSSYNQKRTVQMNYAVLANMYRQRKGHKLDEWNDFCKWVETLPYSELIKGGE